jgi:streptogramin lyase
MTGMNRTIARLAWTPLLLGALSIAALAMAPAAAAASRPPTIKAAKFFALPWDTDSYSVAVGPEGVPWFGTIAESTLSLVSAGGGSLQVDDLDPNRELVGGSEWGSTGSLRFDAQGNLWFIRSAKAGAALVRRATDGTETAFPLSGGRSVSSLTVGADGDAWFTRGARIAEMTPTGTVTQFPLAAKSHPGSLVAGSDGAFWFIEESAGKIGRITPGGQIRFFALGPKVHPRQIVAGPDGNLWFSENDRRGPHQERFDRIGRITTDGKVTQFPIRFGGGIEELAAGPRGPIWFTTAKQEISSISTAGTVGSRGCLGSCSSSFTSIAAAPDGDLWFALAKEYTQCLECGGGTGLILENEGSVVGEIPAGALKPAVRASR